VVAIFIATTLLTVGFWAAALLARGSPVRD